MPEARKLYSRIIGEQALTGLQHIYFKVLQGISYFQVALPYKAYVTIYDCT